MAFWTAVRTCRVVLQASQGGLRPLSVSFVTLSDGLRVSRPWPVLPHFLSAQAACHVELGAT